MLLKQLLTNYFRIICKSCKQNKHVLVIKKIIIKKRVKVDKMFFKKKNLRVYLSFSFLLQIVANPYTCPKNIIIRSFDIIYRVLLTDALKTTVNKLF